ncbi:MAG TPA: hypothetical protein VF625_16280 [Longimicrobium sp.]|jgi:hypothetical protein
MLRVERGSGENSHRERRGDKMLHFVTFWCGVVRIGAVVRY